jgi:hypothetical protein
VAPRPAPVEGVEVNTSDYVLTRFRADPRKVRVSVRRRGDTWRASLMGEVPGFARPQVVAVDGKHASVAIGQALRRAVTAGMLGIDIAMGWSYLHPFGAAGVRARGELGAR